MRARYMRHRVSVQPLLGPQRHTRMLSGTDRSGIVSRVRLSLAKYLRRLDRGRAFAERGWCVPRRALRCCGGGLPLAMTQRTLELAFIGRTDIRALNLLGGALTI
jgi:hypothetical protein